jgi:hypothetical protein
LRWGDDLRADEQACLWVCVSAVYLVEAGEPSYRLRRSLNRDGEAWAASGADRPTNRAYGGVMDDEDDIDPSDDPIYRAGVLMGRNQTLTDVMERLFSPDAASAENTVRAISEWARQTQEEVRVEMRLVFADLDAEEDEDEEGDA